MGTEAPDPKTFSSWEEAFQYPIPAVRGMEKQLRRDIDSNREKLRTLVGASYRDLLGTAESIIFMDSQMHTVEAYMGELGRRCNTRVLEKKGSNLRAWSEKIEAPNSARYAFASHLAVLRSCPDVISRLLKGGDSLLLAAKVLVISRLLHTKLSQRANPPPYLETLRNKLGNLRRRLLARIDRRFKSLDLARDILLEAMCAFALATSSSAKDVLRHYHHIRQEAISESMAKSSTGHEYTLLALQLYVKTLQDSQAVIPNQLAHVLEKLKSTPLFTSGDVYSLMELNLDVHERWIGDDIKSFTPYLRHDDLSKAEAERSLKQWAKQAFSSFLSGLQHRIENMQEPQALMQLRGQILELWLSNHQQSMGINTAESLDGFREVFNLQATRIIQSRASKLELVGTIVYEILLNWQPSISDLPPSLWDSSMTSIEISNGGKVFREALEARSHGKSGPLDRFSYEYKMFLSSIEAIEEMINGLRGTKWQDDMDDVEDDDDLIDNKQVLLSEDDPRLLQDALNNALHEAYTDLQISLGKGRGQLHEKDSGRGQKSCFLIRTWRELRQHLPRSYQNTRLGLDAIPELQHIIAEETLDSPLQRCSRRLRKTAKPAGILPSRPLWEGDPELPVLPSPWTYRFLLDVMSSMTACGSDIWSPQATDALKREVIVQMASLLEKAFTHKPMVVNGDMNGESGPVQNTNINPKTASTDEHNEVKEAQVEDITEECPTDAANDTPASGSTIDGESHPSGIINGSSTDTKIQTVFDTAYLINATAIKDLPADDNELVTLQKKLEADLTSEAKSMDRMKKDAAEYWKRTSLLFGLLA